MPKVNKLHGVCAAIRISNILEQSRTLKVQPEIRTSYPGNTISTLPSREVLTDKRSFADKTSMLQTEHAIKKESIFNCLVHQAPSLG